MSGGAAFSDLMASLDAPLVVVTTGGGDLERAGCLVGFHGQSSMDPARYAVWLSKANHTYRVALHSPHLAIHFLTTSDLALAEHFGSLTGDDVDKFADRPIGLGPGGVPILTECPHRLVARRLTVLDEGGDHVCVVTEPLESHSSGPFEPLRLHHVDHLRPGHENDERPEPPTERAVSG
jgi:flavin reductase (DIM6/NTAB) family NADH-FMN oxidoreductase RutF